MKQKVSIIIPILFVDAKGENKTMGTMVSLIDGKSWELISNLVDFVYVFSDLNLKALHLKFQHHIPERNLFLKSLNESAVTY